MGLVDPMAASAKGKKETQKKKKGGGGKKRELLGPMPPYIQKVRPTTTRLSSSKWFNTKKKGVEVRFVGAMIVRRGHVEMPCC